jgi:hypothetical protein
MVAGMHTKVGADAEMRVMLGLAMVVLVVVVC